MGAHIIVRQDSDFMVEIEATDPHDPESDELEDVRHVYQLTPYTMLMASLAICTANVLHTYAHHHGVDLEVVELDVRYDRLFGEDCEECTAIDEYREHFEEEITLIGDLSPQERERLYSVSRHCPVHKILAHGSEVKSYLAEG